MEAGLGGKKRGFDSPFYDYLANQILESSTGPDHNYKIKENDHYYDTSGNKYQLHVHREAFFGFHEDLKEVGRTFPTNCSPDSSSYLQL